MPAVFIPRKSLHGNYSNFYNYRWLLVITFVFFLLIKICELVCFISYAALSQLRIFRTAPSPSFVRLRSEYLDIKDAQWAEKNDECQILYDIIKFKTESKSKTEQRHRNPKWTFWAPENSAFFRSGQNCRVDRNWPGANFLQNDFSCAIISFTYSNFCVKKT